MTETGRSPDPAPDPDVRTLYRDPGVRNYMFAGLAALAMVFVVLFQQGSDVGGLIVVMIGVAGLVLRWAAAPPLLVLVLTYFLVFPYFTPELPPASMYEIRLGRFRVVDMVLVFSVVVYLACQYRVLGLVQQALPPESRYPRKGEKPVRRPPGLIAEGEITRMLYVAAGVVFAGQLVWLFATAVVVDVGESFPLRVSSGRGIRGFTDDSAGTLSPAASRFVLLAGLAFFSTLLARLVFGYWRLRVMNPDEGAMVLQDAGWDETRRERARLETWRVRGRERAAARARKAERGARR
jgi:hypothetical protein